MSPRRSRRWKVPVLRKNPQFRVFLDIFAHPKSSTQPVLKIGDQNQTLFSTFVASGRQGT